ncbi:hypothetical protein B0T26DRAFT_656510 [Lasiosphaeria miniovina]|uniref:Uncharacterized protein n=1 Tax=Lasiosphaeria miniovina TaxID=1954250 RepID=A0AA39ZYD9_9PEZI|nr:uncharacterized protein B0T26DRAFT_656510 [Lasiosphaeria miniovina]KAK0705912.1 hypothetical protein B0T26DRAFT_656510 [Lasiosphaeria miniovina]
MLSPREKFGVHALLAFFSTRVLRGGPKILLHLAACLVVFILIIRFTTPTAHTASPLADVYAHGGSSKDGSASGLRIVVFGADDIAMPAPVRGLEKETSRAWTEVLCQELKCSQYQSFVPAADNNTHAMVSNSIYDAAVEHLMNETWGNHSPGGNYGFQADEFPVVSLPDLSRQVSAFLGTRTPSTRPNETLWVFTFGTWDVWALASMPLNISGTVIELLADSVFDEAERLYHSALDEGSVAWSGVAGQQRGGGATAKRNAYPDNTNPETDMKGRRADQFSIMIPTLFDPSLTPGWDLARPALSAVHSKAEQLRNAAALTGKWNSRLAENLHDWVRGPGGGRTTPQGQDEPSASASASLLDRIASRNKYPLRDAFLHDQAGLVLDAVVERQLRDGGMADTTNPNAQPEAEVYRHVRTPCVLGGAPCEAPHQHLFLTPFKVGSRAVADLGRRAAAMVRRGETLRANWAASGGASSWAS